MVRPPGARATPAVLGRLRNADVRWTVLATKWRSGKAQSVPGAVELRRGSPAAALDADRTSASTRELLAALRNPEAFVAAHVLLTRRNELRLLHPGPAEWWWKMADRQPAAVGDHLMPRRNIAGEYFGMRFEARFEDVSEFSGTTRLEFEPRIVPGQLSAVREHWHRRLNVPLYSVTYPALLAMTSILPAFHGAVTVLARVLRRARRRAGVCPVCGYDLRATPGRCPECGSAAAERRCVQ